MGMFAGEGVCSQKYGERHAPFGHPMPSCSRTQAEYEATMNKITYVSVSLE